jgi:bifunctional UDP-N-acetylglucosamine pyrophosphorylase/glucosamine-1-phosphate N-acetyltransferase
LILSRVGRLVATFSFVAGASFHCVDIDTPSEAVALARAKQVNKAGLATKLFERMRALKAAKGKS